MDDSASVRASLASLQVPVFSRLTASTFLFGCVFCHSSSLMPVRGVC